MKQESDLHRYKLMVLKDNIDAEKIAKQDARDHTTEAASIRLEYFRPHDKTPKQETATEYIAKTLGELVGALCGMALGTLIGMLLAYWTVVAWWHAIFP